MAPSTNSDPKDVEGQMPRNPASEPGPDQADSAETEGHGIKWRTAEPAPDEPEHARDVEGHARGRS